MSKIGKQSVKIPQGIVVDISEYSMKVKNSKGQEIETPILRGVKPTLEGEELKFALLTDSKQTRSNWGTLRSLISNAVLGLTKGFEKTLILEGVGYRISKEGENLSLNLGFSHPVRYEAPKGITFEVEKNTILKIKGFSKDLVGQVAAEIRALKKPEPYKGKGFHYSDEVVRRKAGKKAVATSGAA